MNRMLLPLAAALLAAGSTAQVATPSTLTAKTDFGVLADAGNKVLKTEKAGALLRPVMLEARDLGATRDHFAYAKMQVGLYAPFASPKPGMGRWFGGYLLNGGHAVAPANSKAEANAYQQDMNFDWAFDTGNELNGKILVFFEGHIFGGATITANIDQKLLDPGIKEGRFALKDEIPVAKLKAIALNFGMKAATPVVADGKASYHGHLYFYFVPMPVQPTFKWESFAKGNCAQGKFVDPGPITPGVPFDIGLTGATDIGSLTTSYALLFVGTNDKNFFFIPLPFDLTLIGGVIPGPPAVPCLLYIDIHGQRPAKLDNGDAKLSFSVPRGLFFKELYFQWAYASDLTKLGLVFTDHARLYKE